MASRFLVIVCAICLFGVAGDVWADRQAYDTSGTSRPVVGDDDTPIPAPALRPSGAVPTARACSAALALERDMHTVEPGHYALGRWRGWAAELYREAVAGFMRLRGQPRHADPRPTGRAERG